MDNFVSRSSTMVKQFKKSFARPDITIVAIIVAYNYIDTLAIMLPVNIHNFKKVYVMTGSDDVKTIEFCNKFSTVNVILYDFYNSGRIFDKGGAIKLAQSVAYKNFPDSWYLLLDADIVVPKNLYQVLNSIELNEECIYGMPRLILYNSSEVKMLTHNKKIERLRSHIHNHKYYITTKTNKFILGYFQFYKKKVFYDNSKNCSIADFVFNNKFSRYGFITSYYVYHLGNTEKNWDGKVEDYKITCKIDLKDYEITTNSAIIVKYVNGQSKILALYKFDMTN